LHNFFDTSEEKITEKAFSQSMIVSVLSILLCIVALCSITYAWFIDSIESNTNTILSGSFDMTVSVEKNATATESATAVTVVPHASRAGVYVCEITDTGTNTYTVTLGLNNATVKGHCALKVGDYDYVHTDAIIGASTANADGLTQNDPFTFTVTVTGPTTLIFEARWGVVVEPDVYYNGAYTPTGVPGGQGGSAPEGGE